MTENILHQKYEMHHGHSISDNFASMIAQIDQRPTMAKKPKNKKSSIEESLPDIYTVRFEKPIRQATTIVAKPMNGTPESSISAGVLPDKSLIQSPSASSSTSIGHMQNAIGGQSLITSYSPPERTYARDDEIVSQHTRLQDHKILEDCQNTTAPVTHNAVGSIESTSNRPCTPNRSQSHCHFDNTGAIDDASSNQRTESMSGTTPMLSSHTSLEPTSIEEITALIADSTPSIPGEKELVKGTERTDYSETPKGTIQKASRKRAADAPQPEFRGAHSKPLQVSKMNATVLAQQSIHAAYASRLSPFTLHSEEYQLLRPYICHFHVTAYINIRNRILRLWVRNPLVQVTADEAVSCARSPKWSNLARVAYEWLVRKGYINFGCVEIPWPNPSKHEKQKIKRSKRKTIVVIGAGMAGLSCARQLEGLVRQYHARWTRLGEDMPRIILLEGRNRIGGRIYSLPLRSQQSDRLPHGSRCTVETGAHIIIGFDHGNPLSMIVRGQLGLHYHTLKDNSHLYDTDGRVVNKRRDRMVEALYNDCLDRASAYRNRIKPPKSVSGDRDMIESGREPQGLGSVSIATLEALELSNSISAKVQIKNEDDSDIQDGVVEGPQPVFETQKRVPPARAAEAMGWRLGENVLSYDDLDLDAVAKSAKNPSLGAAMDEAVKQYQFLLDLTPQDMRLINWHYANLEYANAANVGKLSLEGWDQDAGNEFEGSHTQIIGGYQQVPRGLLHLPTKLDIRSNKIVDRIEYNIWSGNSRFAGAKVGCNDGEEFEADHIVLTTPLGVLKNRSMDFIPALPAWKCGAIERLGFGILNKCILIYEEPFWDVDQDMFGLLREPEVKESLDQEDYVSNRGRFYFFWNCIKTSGRPVLISLMAGDAAQQAENIPDAVLVSEVTKELSKIFKDMSIPAPQETIITRWGKDPFARGTYSFVGTKAKPGDYDTMAAPVGNLHFAGEATCATHPATVHGAYISGLRAAAEVIEDLLGPIEIPDPLIQPPMNTSAIPKHPDTLAQPLASQSNNVSTPTLGEEATVVARSARLDAFESQILEAIHNKLGLRPQPPKSSRSNAFLLYTSAQWSTAKAALDTFRAANPNQRAARSDAKEIRRILGDQWTSLSAAEKLPYQQKAEATKARSKSEALTYGVRLQEWDNKAMDVRRRFIQQQPHVLTKEEERHMWEALRSYGGAEDKGERKAKRASGYAYVSSVQDGDVQMALD